MFVVAHEVIRSLASAGVAVDTLLVDVKLTRCVDGPLLRCVCHAPVVVSPGV